ncbi:MAG: hypothetical protein WCW64_09785, partial [Phycisphaerae bacterium]
MFKFNKSKSILITSLLTLTVFVLPVSAVDLPFNPNDYTFLVYNPDPSGDIIRDAMLDLGITNYDRRGYVNGEDFVDVNATDLASHDILIVGSNFYGDTTGLHSGVLAAGITGRVILTGHDADLHIVLNVEDAETFLVNAINYVLTGSG